MLSGNAKTIPIFWGHGSVDPLVRPEIATQSVKYLLTQCGITNSDGKTPSGLEFKMYSELEHSSSTEELRDLKSWLTSVLPSPGEDK